VLPTIGGSLRDPLGLADSYSVLKVPLAAWLAPLSSSDPNVAGIGAKVKPFVPLICKAPTGTQGQGLPL